MAAGNQAPQQGSQKFAFSSATAANPQLTQYPPGSVPVTSQGYSSSVPHAATMGPNSPPGVVGGDPQMVYVQNASNESVNWERIFMLGLPMAPVEKPGPWIIAAIFQIVGAFLVPFLGCGILAYNIKLGHPAAKTIKSIYFAIAIIAITLYWGLVLIALLTAIISSGVGLVIYLFDLIIVALSIYFGIVCIYHAGVKGKAYQDFNVEQGGAAPQQPPGQTINVNVI